jgi:hypothetical protein
MSEAIQGQSEQPAASTQPAPGSEQQPAQETPIRIETATMEELESALYPDVVPDAPEPAEQPAPEAAPEPEQEPEAEPDGEQQPGEAQAPVPAGNSSGRIKRRLSVSNLPPDQQTETAQALEMVREGKAADLLDALTQIRGIQPQAQQPAATDQPPAQAEPEAKPPTLTDLEQRLTDLREQRDVADEAFDKPEFRRLTAEIEDLGIQIAEARAEAKANQRLQQQESASYETKVDAAFDAMEERYPEAADENSTFYRLLADKVAAAEARKDPALRDPNFISVFADEIAGILQGAPKAPPPAKPQAAPKGPVGTGVAPGHTQPTRFTESQKLHAIKTASFEDLDAALYGD